LCVLNTRSRISRPHLQAFLSDPQRYAHMGEEGRQYVQTHHTPGAYVQAIIDTVRDAEAFRPHAIVHDMARKVGMGMRRWTNLPVRDIVPYPGGQVAGCRHDQTEVRTSLEGLNYQHLEALKDLREKLWEQV
jgi:hypothetical protein